jgi:hypothetical protein
MDIKVSEPVAEYFMEQCVGSSNGHMMGIPNCPALYGLCRAHRIDGKKDFARFLIDVAEQLNKQPPF